MITFIKCASDCKTLGEIYGAVKQWRVNAKESSVVGTAFFAALEASLGNVRLYPDENDGQKDILDRRHVLAILNHCYEFLSSEQTPLKTEIKAVNKVIDKLKSLYILTGKFEPMLTPYQVHQLFHRPKKEACVTHSETKQTLSRGYQPPLLSL